MEKGEKYYQTQKSKRFIQKQALKEFSVAREVIFNPL